MWFQHHRVMSSGNDGDVETFGCEFTPTEIGIVIVLVFCFSGLNENDAASKRRRLIGPNKLNSRLTTLQPMVKIFNRYFRWQKSRLSHFFKCIPDLFWRTRLAQIIERGKRLLFG